ncbi:N-acetylmuramoyl-L-alanine amidase [Nocardioides panacisoli]|uniref:Peptidoglycan recognition protein family domain-containing protein n=1 Tax=Nocardioides panacisoli TaxID=627624 RepID=A0ABP7I2K8_9ACTN
MLSSTSRTRFITVCQQLLALAVVLAFLTPAARTITMDVRPPAHGGVAGDVRPDAYLRAAERPSRVPAAPVDPKVSEYSMTAPAGARLAPGMLKASARRTPGGGQEIVSRKLPVRGYGAVGVTWQHGDDLAQDQIKVQARYRMNGSWSAWTPVTYDGDHGPDPGSAEARNARPGTDPLFVGNVDDVQVRVDTKSTAPADMKLAVVDPGKATTVARQAPRIDTGAGDAGTEEVPSPDGNGGLDLSAQVVAPKPKIFSRAQWGADESMRDKPSLHYGDVHAGFIHHTVNANDYTRAEVPAIIRGIYAYHTQSRGWSDIGYNYLVDRFGRIWEGRYGGVDRDVVGAHTLGYNDDSFAMSAIGNYEVAHPSDAMLDAYARLFAWKLGLHGIGAGWKRTWVTSRYFQAINGHRDAESTACPGKYLYAKIPDIRAAAVQDQGSWSGRDLQSDYVGSERPDLVARQGGDSDVVLLPVHKRKGVYSLGAPVDTGLHLPGARNIMRVGDWDKDGINDLVTRNDHGALDLYRGLGDGKFDQAQVIGTGFGRVQLLTAVGDFTGDGFPDLMGQPRGGQMRIYPGNGLKGLKVSYPAMTTVTAQRMIGVGRWDFDGAPDVLTRSGDTLQLRTGNGPGGLAGTKPVTLDVAGYDWLAGVSDVDMTGHSDVIARQRSNGQMYLFPGTRSGFGDRIALGKVGDAYNYIG